MAGMGNGTSARVLSLLPCLALASLALAACMQTGEEAATMSVAPAAAAAVSSPASPPTARQAGGGGGARGGATTASARSSSEPVEVGADPLTQARADCWMKVETQKGMRGIDQRSAFVDKCVAEQIRPKPSP
jgi:hypothetical protein